MRLLLTEFSLFSCRWTNLLRVPVHVPQLNRVVFIKRSLRIFIMTKAQTPFCVHLTQKHKSLLPVEQHSPGIILRLKYRQMGFYGRRSAQRSPSLSMLFFLFSIDGSAFLGAITHKLDLWSAHVYVFMWVRSHLHRSFPVLVCSWHISHLSLPLCILPCSLFL